MPGDVQACPKAGKKSLSHPKYIGGLTHLLQGKVRSKQLSVPLGHRKPCQKDYTGGRDGLGSMHNWGYLWHCPGAVTPPFGCLSLQKCADIHTHAPCLLSYPTPAPVHPLPVSPRLPLPGASRAASHRGVVPSCPRPLLPIACKSLVQGSAPQLTHSAPGRQGLGWGEPLVGCASAKPHRVTLKGHAA